MNTGSFADAAEAVDVEFEQYCHVPLDELRESPLNPRKHFDAHKLEDLTASIRARGVLTPLIVREVAGGIYEIAAGHRRYRAAKAAGIKAVPCRVLALDDQEFLEVLTIENLQHEEIHPLEEGDGYAELLKQGRYDVATLADKVGKPVKYIRGRLELVDLVPVVRESFLQDAITIGHARLISRVDPDKQEETLKKCFGGWQDRLCSVSDLRSRLRNDCGANLDDAPFDVEATYGQHGPCSLCPRRSDVQMSIKMEADDEDGETALCLDRACYGVKVNAFVQSKAAAGLVQISNDYMEKKVPAGVLPSSAFVQLMKPTERRLERLKQSIAAIEVEIAELGEPDSDKEEDLAALREELEEIKDEETKCTGKSEAIVMEGHDRGEVMYICQDHNCPVHAKQLDRQQNRVSGSSPDVRDDEKKRKLEQRIQWEKRKRTVVAILSTYGTKAKIGDYELRLVAQKLACHATPDFCKAFGLPLGKGEYAKKKVNDWAEDASGPELVRLLVGLSLEAFCKEYVSAESCMVLDEVADHCGVDQKAILKEVKDDLKPKKKAAAKKAAKPAKVKPVKVQTCRDCGCTDATPCISEYGEACSWTEHDLCSACTVKGEVDPK